MTNLIVETLDQPVGYLIEGEGSDKKYFIEGVFLQAELKNKNGRVYPGTVMEREVSRYNESHIKGNRAWGELNHPPTPTVNLDRVSHRTVDLRREGHNWVGKAMIITETPMGAIVKNLLESGGQLGTSSRGLGSLKKNNLGIMEVQDDFRLAVAGDIVSDPSGPDCFVRGIMEGLYEQNDNGVWVSAGLDEDIDNIKQVIHDTPKSQFNEESVRQFERFLQKLANT